MEYIFSYFLDIIFALITALVLYLYKKTKKVLQTIENTKKSILNIIESIILEKYNMYTKQKYICLYEKESLNKLYLEYQKLGGSGIVDKLYKEIDKIKIDKRIDNGNKSN